mmetsp:Transcript_28780/g.73870  ORF Transcript_28780/g.73870 Transcript_28780/m.73870 type:complete len:102 (-) Transcript_28780:437-742(-)
MPRECFERRPTCPRWNPPEPLPKGLPIDSRPCTDPAKTLSQPTARKGLRNSVTRHSAKKPFTKKAGAGTGWTWGRVGEEYDAPPVFYLDHRDPNYPDSESD